MTTNVSVSARIIGAWTLLGVAPLLATKLDHRVMPSAGVVHLSDQGWNFAVKEKPKRIFRGAAKRDLVA